MTYTLHHGDCLAVLRTLPDESIDSIVTDPPYGLSNTDPKHVAETLTKWVTGDHEYTPPAKGGFMGKTWDSFVPPPAVWVECMRVLKPGGHLLVFAGTRTQDLMGLSIRLAGFDIRDGIGWIYGSGFPKSMDVSKAIDKAAGVEREVVGRYTRPDGSAPRDNVTAAKFSGTAYNGGEVGGDGNDGVRTAPATPEAERWAGWGTALKPAHEPIVCAQKPFNPVHFEVEYDTTHHLIGALTWLSLTPAKRAELTSPSSPHAQPAATCVSARALVAAASSLDVSAKTATFSSPAQASTLSNIASSWNSILGALSDPTTTSTTSTASSTTTGLRILNSLLAPITSHTTMPACECLQSGGQSSVSNAAQSSSDEWARWLHTLSASVPESVIEATATAACHALAAIAETLSLTGQGVSESFAPKPAPTGTATSSGGLQSGIVSGAGDGTSPAGMLDGSAPSDARGTRPQSEPVIVARKPLEGTVAGNVLEWGTGALNIDASRVATDWSTDPTRRGWQGRNLASESGVPFVDHNKAESQPNPAGRWPANVLLDPEAAEAMDQQSGNLSPGARPGNTATRPKFNGATYSGGKVYDGKMDEPRVAMDSGGGASRFFPVFKYQAKAPKKERPVIYYNECECDQWQSQPKATAVSTSMGEQPWSTSTSGNNTTGQSQKATTFTTSTTTNSTIGSRTCSASAGSSTNASTQGASCATESGGSPAECAENSSLSAGTTGISAPKGGPSTADAGSATSPRWYTTSECESCGEQRRRVTHCTVKPLALMSWLVTLITPPGGTVLDPFAGSGTTLQAARDKGFHGIGIEADPDHCDLIRKRLDDDGLLAA